MKTLLLMGTIIGALSIGSAHATETFTLNQDGCSGGCGANDYGTIVIAPGTVPGSVLVTETLNQGIDFVKTGAGSALAFSLIGNPAIIVTNLTTGFSVGGVSTSGAFGPFEYSIDCTGCGSGASKPLPGPLSFTLTDTAHDLTPESFTGNNFKYPDFFFFASDIVNTNVSGHRSGNVAAVTEPMTAAILGFGLLMLGLVKERSFSKI